MSDLQHFAAPCSAPDLNWTYPRAASNGNVADANTLLGIHTLHALTARYNDAEEANGEDEDDFSSSGSGSGSDTEAFADHSTRAETNAQQLRRHNGSTDSTVAMAPKATPIPNATKRVESERNDPTKRAPTPTPPSTPTPNRTDAISDRRQYQLSQ